MKSWKLNGKTCFGPKSGFLILERLTVGRVKFNLGYDSLLEVRVNLGAEMGPNGVSSTTCLGTKDVFVISAL